MAAGKWGSQNGPMLAAYDPASGAMKQGKISEMILDFGSPVVQQLVKANAPLKVWRDAMQFVITVWNAHVMALPLWGQPEILAELRATVAGPAAPPEMRAMLEALSRERQTRFATVPLVVGEWSVRQLPDGGFSLRCDARLPGKQ